jgi:uncharacterized membrane protein
VEYRVRLDDDNATAAFTSVQADIERNASEYTQDFAMGMRRTVRTATNRTGREMALENVTVTATNETLPQLYGVVTYEFRWTNFAATDGNRLRMGDALAGLFLDAESSLSLSWPSGYEAASVTPAATESMSNRVVWRGPMDFGPDEPSVVVRPAGGPPTLAIGAAVALLLAGLVAGWVVVRRRRTDERASDVLADDGAAASAGGAVADTGESEADSEQTAEADDDESADAPPEELLSNEEKVLRLLDEHGGRIKQQEIASEYDWTDAKTSQVVGKLRDEDEVETFRIGRENVVTLPEESDL